MVSKNTEESRGKRFTDLCGGCRANDRRACQSERLLGKSGAKELEEDVAGLLFEPWGRIETADFGEERPAVGGRIGELEAARARQQEGRVAGPPPRAAPSRSSVRPEGPAERLQLAFAAAPGYPLRPERRAGGSTGGSTGRRRAPAGPSHACRRRGRFVSGCLRARRCGFGGTGSQHSSGAGRGSGRAKVAAVGTRRRLRVRSPERKAE